MARDGVLFQVAALNLSFFPSRIIPQLENSPSQVSPSSLPGSEISEATRTYLQGVSRYDLDELDACWLELVNMELKEMGECCCCYLLAWASQSGHSGFSSNCVEQKALKKKSLLRHSKRDCVDGCSTGP